jgi:filamentous hemagglutinin family protein
LWRHGRTLRRWIAYICSLALVLAPLPSYALPQNGTIREGQGTIVQTSPTRIDVTQSSQRLIIDWSSFNLALGEQIFFNQQALNASVLNRVTGAGASSINGQIGATGSFALVNPAGITFGQAARIDVGSLIATTANIRNPDFMAGRYAFTEASPIRDATILNQGVINVAQGGYAALSAAAVRNEGLIVARLGTVVLGGAKAFTIDLDGDRLLSYQVNTPVDQAPAGVVALLDNPGQIKADGGRVLMTARAAKGVLDNVINTSGLVQATTAQLVNGEIVIDGGDSGAVLASGRIDASGRAQGETGGVVKVLGENVGLLAGTVIDVAGDSGGGTALIGGNYLGKGPEANAKATYVDGSARVEADALVAGDGGRVIVWSDEYTGFFGKITARGGVEGGNGGFVETSSKNNLQAFGTVRAEAPAGLPGAWLLDPHNVTISTATLNGSLVGGIFTPIADDATIDATTIRNTLNTGTSVTVTTGSTGTQAGNITVASAINKTSGTAATLTLDAAGNIVVNAGFSSNSSTMSVNLYAGGSITVAAAIDTNGGTFTTAGTGGTGNATTFNNTGGTITAGAGNITLNQSGAITIGSAISGASITLTGGSIAASGAAVTATGTVTLAAGGNAIVVDNAANSFSSVRVTNTGGGSGAVSLRTTTALDFGGAGATTLSTGSLNVIAGRRRRLVQRRRKSHNAGQHQQQLHRAGFAQHQRREQRIAAQRREPS